MVNFDDLLNAFGGIEPIDDKFSPMSEKELKSFEAGLGARLPDAYRSFVTIYGSCVPRELVCYDPIKKLPSEMSEDGKGNLAIFYGTGGDPQDAYSLQRRLKYYSGRIPDNLIPIADDGGGNQILLGISGKEAGKIYYWDFPNEQLDEKDYLEEHGKPRSQKAMFANVYPIAKSFEDLLQRLEAEPEEEV